MQALVKAAENPHYPAEIALILSNKNDAKGLIFAQEKGINNASIPHQNFSTRELFEEALHTQIIQHRIDIVCLAGFMRVLTPWLISRWEGRMLNIHPSLLPLFKGLHTHQQALDAKVTSHGCTVHHVVPELDSGQIIVQASVPVFPDDTVQTLAARVLIEEHRIYPLALEQLANSL